MEINITSLLDLPAFNLSHSRAEGGENAGRNSWQAAMDQAEETALLDTPEKLEAFRDWVADTGAWDEDERNAWTPQECNALFLQWIAGDVRQCPAILDGVTFEERTTTESRWKDGRFIDQGTAEWWYDVLDESGNDNEDFGPFPTRSAAYKNHAGHARPPRAESLEEIDWLEYEAQASEGSISSNLFRADDGTVYFSLSH